MGGGGASGREVRREGEKRKGENERRGGHERRGKGRRGDKARREKCRKGRKMVKINNEQKKMIGFKQHGNAIYDSC